MVVLDIRREETWAVACRLRCETNELLELSHIGIVFDGCYTLDGLGTIRNRRHYFVGMADVWILDVLVLQVNSVGETFDARTLDMEIVDAIPAVTTS